MSEQRETKQPDPTTLSTAQLIRDVEQIEAESLMVKRFLHEAGTDPDAWIDGVLERLATLLTALRALPVVEDGEIERAKEQVIADATADRMLHEHFTETARRVRYECVSVENVALALHEALPALIATVAAVTRDQMQQEQAQK